MGDQPSAGWYHDPGNTGRQRWWDGQRWTDHVRQPADRPAAVGTPPPRRRTRLVVGLAIGALAVVGLAAAVFTVTDPFGSDVADAGPSITAGEYTTCARTPERTVACWGANGQGQPNAGGSWTTPVTVDVVDDVAGAAASGTFNCALHTDRTVSCWGRNSYGQLGQPPSDELLRTPVTVDVADVQAVDVGLGHVCVLHDNGTVSCWGMNDAGQLGDGTVGSDPFHQPRLVDGIDDAVAVTAGAFFTCVLHADGTVSCWGGLWDLRDGERNRREIPRPEPVPGLTDIVEVNAGAFHTCALHTSGQVSCWGWNRNGELGDGTFEDRDVPVRVVGLDDVVQLDADGHTCARHADGRVSCWGHNNQGQLGDGTFESRSVPAPVDGISSSVDIALGYSHTCTADADGRVWCWGDNTSGQLGDGNGGDFDRNSPWPTQVVGLTLDPDAAPPPSR